MQRLYAQFIYAPSWPQGKPSCGGNAPVWVTVQDKSFYWSDSEGLIGPPAEVMASGCWELPAYGRPSGGFDNMRNGPALLSAPETSTLSLSSLGAGAKDGRPWRGSSGTSSPTAACLCVCVVCVLFCTWKWIGLYQFGQLLTEVGHILWPWLEWAREELKAVKRLKDEKKHMQKKKADKRIELE